MCSVDRLSVSSDRSPSAWRAGSVIGSIWTTIVRTRWRLSSTGEAVTRQWLCSASPCVSGNPEKLTFLSSLSALRITVATGVRSSGISRSESSDVWRPRSGRRYRPASPNVCISDPSSEISIDGGMRWSSTAS